MHERVTENAAISPVVYGEDMAAARSIEQQLMNEIATFWRVALLRGIA